MKNKLPIIAVICLIIILFLAINFLTNSHSSKNQIIEKEYYNSKGLVITNTKTVNKLIKNKKSFLLFTYNDYCTFTIPCETIFENVAIDNKIEILKIPFIEYKKTSLYKKVKYAPTILLIQNGKIKDYLDANSDEDYPIYQEEEQFKKWLQNNKII